MEIRTSQWASLVNWYREGLGVRSLFRVVDEGYALLAAGNARLAIIAHEDPGSATSRISLALEVPDLLAAVVRLQAMGIDVGSPRENPEGYDEITTTDPDGNQIRLFSWPLER